MIDRRKRGKTLSEVKLVQNIRKNPQIFLEINPVQEKEVIPSYNCAARPCISKNWLKTNFVTLTKNSSVVTSDTKGPTKYLSTPLEMALVTHFHA